MEWAGVVNECFVKRLDPESVLEDGWLERKEEGAPDVGTA